MHKNNATIWGKTKNIGLNQFLTEKAKQFRKDLIKRATKEEKIFRSFLDRNGIKYQFQKIMYLKNSIGNIKKFYILDFYLTEYKIAVEIDGGYHNTKEQMELDALRESEIIKQYPEIRFLRFKNEDIKHSIIREILEDYISEL